MEPTDNQKKKKKQHHFFSFNYKVAACSMHPRNFYVPQLGSQLRLLLFFYLYFFFLTLPTFIYYCVNSFPAKVMDNGQHYDIMLSSSFVPKRLQSVLILTPTPARPVSSKLYPQRHTKKGLDHTHC